MRRILAVALIVAVAGAATTQSVSAVDEIARWQELHDSAVEDDAQALGYINMLERRHDQMTERMMPTGDDLAAELEAFLRDNDDEK